MIAKKFQLNGVLIGRNEIDIMRKTTITVFEILEKYWSTQDCVLVDIKIEFGVTTKGKFVTTNNNMRNIFYCYFFVIIDNYRQLQ